MIRVKAIESYGQRPLYQKFSLITLGVLALLIIIYLGQGIILPFAFSSIIAILLNPLVNFFVKNNINRVVAIGLALFISFAFTSGLFLFIVSEMVELANAAPQWEERVENGIEEIVKWISLTFGINREKIATWIELRQSEAVNISSSFIGQTLFTVTRVVILFFLIPVYIFLILFYKKHLLRFISQIFSVESHGTVVGALSEIRGLIQNYLSGLLIETAIMTVLNSLTLAVIGIQYPILIGLLCSLLNVIPYIGGIIAVMLTMMFALITVSPFAALLVVIAHVSVTFIDINYLNPKIVGGKVKINALASIVAVLIGGQLCGAPGMFLAIPFVGIFKVICDRTAGLNAVGTLLGDNMPGPGVQLFKAVTSTAAEIVSTRKEE